MNMNERLYIALQFRIPYLCSNSYFSRVQVNMPLLPKFVSQQQKQSTTKTEENDDYEIALGEELNQAPL